MHRAGWNPNATTASDQARETASKYLQNEPAIPLPPPESSERQALSSVAGPASQGLTLRQLLSGMSLDPNVFNGPLIQGCRNPVATDINGTDMNDPKRHQLL